MKKYLTKETAKRLLITGGIVYGLGSIINVGTAFSVYGQVSDCINSDAKCGFAIQRILAKFAIVLAYTGITTLVLGLVVLFLSRRKR